MMFLKRKRSESELSFSSSSTGSAFSSPTRTGTALATTPSHLPSRTMKRFRDSRPSQDEVHQRTLNMLFSAAQRRPESTSQPHQQQQPQSQSHMAQPQQQQQHAPAAHQASLHNFWKLPPQSLSAAASAATAPSPPVDASMYAPTDCEDCGRGLSRNNNEDDNNNNNGGHNEDASMMDDVDVDMEIGMSGGGSWLEAARCAGCAKLVCSHCSITNMGERRRCLGCADNHGARKGWAGGLGQNLSSLGIC